jgi:hypothetical protein
LDIARGAALSYFSCERTPVGEQLEGCQCAYVVRRHGNQALRLNVGGIASALSFLVAGMASEVIVKKPLSARGKAAFTDKRGCHFPVT